ncbi:MAG: hypothetical protein INR63_31685, partial [Actinomycetospora chiangmaiensis]|nr:hypothetical protein [Actinomycetospora chiangmaiensis]
ALDRLLALAKQKGAAAALLSHGALASGQVADFATRLAAAGVTLVPASALLSPAGAGGKPSATVRAQ